jgi:transposase InsO family protein
MTWKTMDVEDQRVRFVVLASRAERPFSALCAEFGISRPTGYLWLGRYQQRGVAGLCELSRRPQLSPQQTEPGLEAAVVAARMSFPDWGARKLAVLLSRRGIRLPVTTIHRILLRRGLVREEDRQRPAVERFERVAPNQLWQMDFKGPLCKGEALGPLSVLDDHSRYLIALEQLDSTSGALVRERLQQAFTDCGVPEAMLMDHGTPWWGRQAPQGLTRLALWLIRQGVELHFSRVRHPQTQGKVERFHGELQRAVARRGVPSAPAERQGWLNEYRWEHNHLRPHEALAMATPSSRWQPSLRRYDPQPAEWLYAEGAHVLKVDSEGKIKLSGQHWTISLALAGERVQLEHIDERVLVFYCRTLIRELDFARQRSTIVDRCLDAEIS